MADIFVSMADELTTLQDIQRNNALNPIQAKVSLGLRVLSYNDLSITHPGYHLFAQQTAVV